MTSPLAAADAARRVLDEVRRQPALRVPLDDALDSVLAEDIVSPLDIPPWANSAMDGYAVRGADVAGATEDRPVRLRVVEQVPAGGFPTRSLAPGESIRIFTGAPVPAGADSVVRQEDTDLGVDTVTIVHDRDVGGNIRPAGEDIRRGATALTAGTPLGAAHLGVLASLAVAHPLVYRRPRVAILGSGDELVDVDRPEDILGGRKIASSNTHTLLALVRKAGGEPVNLGIARDTPDSLREHLAGALDCDLLVTTAGVSVGEHDYVRSVLQELGAEQRFWRIRMNNIKTMVLMAGLMGLFLLAGQLLGGSQGLVLALIVGSAFDFIMIRCAIGLPKRSVRVRERVTRLAREIVISVPAPMNSGARTTRPRPFRMFRGRFARRNFAMWLGSTHA